MGLSFGWQADDVRESFWIDDPDLENVSAQARVAWNEDGDASHLRPFIRPGGKPALITFRPLNMAESRTVTALMASLADSQLEGIIRAYLLCFRLAADCPDAPARIPAGVDKETGKDLFHDRVVKERGYRMLADPFCKKLDKDYPGIVSFYGRMIFEATYPTESEKKASSPPSTMTPSLATATTLPATESPEKAAQGAPTPSP
jgi:hypothetical protein